MKSAPEMLPRDKHDVERVRALADLDEQTMLGLVPELLTWMQDSNWPVARELAPILAGIGAPLSPAIRGVLSTDDDIWKYWVVVSVVGQSPALATSLRADLHRLANHPTAGEKSEEVEIAAAEILSRLGAIHP